MSCHVTVKTGIAKLVDHAENIKDALIYDLSDVMTRYTYPRQVYRPSSHKYLYSLIDSRNNCYPAHTVGLLLVLYVKRSLVLLVIL
jgi:hypothetical protein